MDKPYPSPPAAEISISVSASLGCAANEFAAAGKECKTVDKPYPSPPAAEISISVSASLAVRRE